MTYARVVPRDLFNEGDLLKCYGRLWICLDELHAHYAELSEGSGAPFDIRQDEGSGALTVANLRFTIGGSPYRLTRPLNTRQPWSLYATDEDDEETAVFTAEGDLSPDFLRLITIARGAETMTTKIDRPLRWRVRGHNRKVGAIGVGEPFDLEVSAPDAEAAIVEARRIRYAAGFEHVDSCRATPA